jgi:hypothetical protein
VALTPSHLKEINYEARDFSKCPVGRPLFSSDRSSYECWPVCRHDARRGRSASSHQEVLRSQYPQTRIESQRLLKYLIAKNASPSSATAVKPQAQAGGTSTRVIAPATAPVPVQAVAELKKPKLTRFGIALPKADFGPGSQGQNTGESRRLLESQYLKGPKIEVVTLTSLLESQVEAKEKECDYIVFSAMTEKKGGGMEFLRGASALMSVIPVAGAARGAAGAIAATATPSAAASAASIRSSQLKAKSDVAFEYHMFAVGNTTLVLENKVTAKAKA